MKKVAVICAAGKQGKLLVNEAVSRGYEVTGFVRGSDKVENAKAKEELHWVAERDLNKMCEDSWRWQSMNPNGYED